MYESEKIYLVNDLCVHGLFDTWYAGTYFFTESGTMGYQLLNRFLHPVAIYIFTQNEVRRGTMIPLTVS